MLVMTGVFPFFWGRAVWRGWWLLVNSWTVTGGCSDRGCSSRLTGWTDRHFSLEIFLSIRSFLQMVWDDTEAGCGKVHFTTTFHYCQSVLDFPVGKCTWNSQMRFGSCSARYVEGLFNSKKAFICSKWLYSKIFQGAVKEFKQQHKSFWRTIPPLSNTYTNITLLVNSNTKHLAHKEEVWVMRELLGMKVSAEKQWRIMTRHTCISVIGCGSWCQSGNAKATSVLWINCCNAAQHLVTWR